MKSNSFYVKYAEHNSKYVWTINGRWLKSAYICSVIKYVEQSSNYITKIHLWIMIVNTLLPLIMIENKYSMFHNKFQWVFMEVIK